MDKRDECPGLSFDGIVEAPSGPPFTSGTFVGVVIFDPPIPMSAEAKALLAADIAAGRGTFVRVPKEEP